MTEEQLCDPQTAVTWAEAFEEVLGAIPPRKRAEVFQAASHVEVVAKLALQALRKAKEARSAAQTG